MATEHYLPPTYLELEWSSPRFQVNGGIISLLTTCTILNQLPAWLEEDMRTVNRTACLSWDRGLGEYNHVSLEESHELLQKRKEEVGNDMMKLFKLFVEAHNGTVLQNFGDGSDPKLCQRLDGVFPLQAEDLRQRIKVAEDNLQWLLDKQKQLRREAAEKLADGQ
jgi:hypothetical protein